MKRRPSAEVTADLERYRHLLHRYHRTLDLMSDGGLARLDDHFVDATTYVEALVDLFPAPTRIMDLGAGAGLPGIVVAASFEGLTVELVERRRKRATFLRMAAGAVGGADVRIHAGDVREAAGAPVDVVMAQAVGTLELVYDVTRHRHGADVVLMSRKGPSWRAEVDALGAATGATIDVVVEEALTQHGTLVAVRVQGGSPCRSSE